ncbi:glycosyltransferase family protein [Photobacterium leiognathi]|uniref:hypothetical protein n=1 Tax=Photobacterium leiognathi TaxID=553611 RepID=UPI002980E7EF|nr:hypothetical protein [Photobacterium leiognathi]
MKKKNIATLICTYEPDHFLCQQITSILDNDSNMPIYISDDSSSSKYINRLNVSSYCHIFPGNQYGSARSNFLMTLKKYFYKKDYDWVFLSDQDDIWMPDKVSKYLQVINDLDDSIPQIIFSDASLINSDNTVIHDSFFKYQGLSEKTLHNDNILFKNCVQGATLCINKKMIELINKTVDYDSIGEIVMHDWWIAILAKYSGNWTFINEPLIKYRQHNNNCIGAKNRMKKISDILFHPYFYKNQIMALSAQYNYFKSESACVKIPKVLKLNLISRVKLYLIRIFDF